MNKRGALLLIAATLVVSVTLAFLGFIDIFHALLITAIVCLVILVIKVLEKLDRLTQNVLSTQDRVKRIEQRQRNLHKALLRSQNKERRALYSSIESLAAVNELIKPRLPLPTMSGWAISADSARVIIDVFKEQKVKTVVDLGSGTSTLIFGYLLEDIKGGSVISIDHDVNFSRQTTENLRKHGLSDAASVYAKPLKKQKIKGKSYLWYDLPNNIGEIDLLLVDGPPAKTQKHSRYPALPVLYEKLSRNAVIILDDYNRDDEREIVNKWLKEFPDLTLQEAFTDKGLAILRRNATPQKPPQ